jgi:hypothetical protein
MLIFLAMGATDAIRQRQPSHGDQASVIPVEAMRRRIEVAVARNAAYREDLSQRRTPRRAV